MAAAGRVAAGRWRQVGGARSWWRRSWWQQVGWRQFRVAPVMGVPHTEVPVMVGPVMVAPSRGGGCGRLCGVCGSGRGAPVA